MYYPPTKPEDLGPQPYLKLNSEVLLLYAGCTCALLLAPAFVLPFADAGAYTLVAILFRWWSTRYPVLTFFLIAPAIFTFVAIPHVAFGKRRITLLAMGAFILLVGAAIVHEVELWRVGPPPGLGMTIGAITFTRYAEAAILFALGALVRNIRRPNPKSAIIFNATVVAWLFTVAFPWPDCVWPAV